MDEVDGGIGCGRELVLGIVAVGAVRARALMQLGYGDTIRALAQRSDRRLR